MLASIGCCNWSSCHSWLQFMLYSCLLLSKWSSTTPCWTVFFSAIREPSFVLNDNQFACKYWQGGMHLGFCPVAWSHTSSCSVLTYGPYLEGHCLRNLKLRPPPRNPALELLSIARGWRLSQETCLHMCVPCALKLYVKRLKCLRQTSTAASN